MSGRDVDAIRPYVKSELKAKFLARDRELYERLYILSANISPQSSPDAKLRAKAIADVYHQEMLSRLDVVVAAFEGAIVTQNIVPNDQVAEELVRDARDAASVESRALESQRREALQGFEEYQTLVARYAPELVASEEAAGKKLDAVLRGLIRRAENEQRKKRKTRGDVGFVLFQNFVGALFGLGAGILAFLLVTQRNAVRFAETQYILRVQEELFAELTPSLSKLVSAGHRSTRSFDSTSGFEREADAVRAAWTPTAIARVRDVYEAAVFEDYQRLMDSSDAIASSLKVLDAEEQSLRALMTATGGRRTRSLDDSSESTGLVDAEVDSLDKLGLYRFEVFTRFDSYIPEAAQSLLLAMRPKIR